MNKSRNYSDDIAIDDQNLEKELINHSILYYRYSDLYDEAKDELQRLELDLSVAEADTAYRIRMKEYDARSVPDKITESVVKELIDSDLELVKKREAIIDQKRVVSKYSTAVESFRHRRYMLQKLVDLWIYEYYNKTKNGVDPLDDDQLRGLADLGNENENDN
jgi:hypothetical protein